MREILFRGKTERKGVWMYGYLFVQAEGTEYEDAFILGDLDYRESIYDIWQCAERIDPKTVGQFTGLMDKNGVKIFEGDILSSSWGYKGEVKFDEIMYAKLECLFNEDCEIIGNIHSNPELLKGEN